MAKYMCCFYQPLSLGGLEHAALTDDAENEFTPMDSKLLRL